MMWKVLGKRQRVIYRATRIESWLQVAYNLIYLVVIVTNSQRKNKKKQQKNTKVSEKH